MFKIELRTIFDGKDVYSGTFWINKDELSFPIDVEYDKSICIKKYELKKSYNTTYITCYSEGVYL